MRALSASRSCWNLCGAEHWSGGVYWSVDRCADSLRLSDGAFAGTAFLPPLDSGEPGFRWGRVRLKLDIPEECSVQLYARATDEEDWEVWRQLDGQPERPDAVRTLFGEPEGFGGDVWLSKTGRRLYLAVAFTGGGARKPRLDAVSVMADCDHMTDYLPAIYQGQDFTYRYLSIFTAMIQELDEEIGGVRRQLDPAAAEAEMLRYLAHWLCADESEPEADLRKMLPRAIEEYETMYTVAGVQRSVRRLTGKTPWIVEHFQVDPNDPSCSDPELYRKLYGDDPYRFFLLLPQGTFSEQRQMERFLERLEELVPAETTPELVLLKPCVQLDWHTYLGINSQIGEYVTAVIDESVTIHYDTTIGGNEHER